MGSRVKDDAIGEIERLGAQLRAGKLCPDRIPDEVEPVLGLLDARMKPKVIAHHDDQTFCPGLLYKLRQLANRGRDRLFEESMLAALNAGAQAGFVAIARRRNDDGIGLIINLAFLLDGRRSIWVVHKNLMAELDRILGMPPADRAVSNNADLHGFIRMSRRPFWITSISSPSGPSLSQVHHV